MRRRWDSGKVAGKRGTLDVLFGMLSDLRMAPAPPSCQLGSEPQSHLPARCREQPTQAFGKLLALGVAHHPEEIPGVVDLASLVGGALEVAGYGRLQAPWSSETTSSTPLRPRALSERNKFW